MSTYPTTLDTLPVANANDTPSLDTHPALHNDVNSAMNAVQGELGTTPSGSHATVKARLDAMDVTQVACSDEVTALTTGTAKATFRVVGARTLVGVRGSLSTAQTSGSVLTVDVHKNGTTVLSTKLTFDNTHKTTTTATNPAVISVASFADDDEVSIDIDAAGDGTAKGLKVSMVSG
jgi:hypothetical protein